MHTGTAEAHEHDYGSNQSSTNGSVLAKISKGSWIVIVLISALTAGVSGFFSVRETLTVGLATVDQRLTELDARQRSSEDMLKQMVPAEVHAEREKRYQLQIEFDKFRFDVIQKEIDELKRPRTEK